MSTARTASQADSVVLKCPRCSSLLRCSKPSLSRGVRCPKCGSVSRLKAKVPVEGAEETGKGKKDRSGSDEEGFEVPDGYRRTWFGKRTCPQCRGTMPRYVKKKPNVLGALVILPLFLVLSLIVTPVLAAVVCGAVIVGFGVKAEKRMYLWICSKCGHLTSET